MWFRTLLRHTIMGLTARLVNVPGFMTAGTVLTPLDTLVTPVGTVVTEQQFENNKYSYQCPTENRYSVLQDRPCSDVLNVNDSAKSASELNNAQGSIPVIMSNRTDKRLAFRRDRYNPRSHPEPSQYENDDSDDDFEMHIRRRSKRFYIGSFKQYILSKTSILCDQERCCCYVDKHTQIW